METIEFNRWTMLGVVVVMACTVTTKAFAEPSPRRRCPRYIGSFETGTVQRAHNAFECFRSKKKAIKKGYIDSKAETTPNFSGQWKLAVALVKDTCGTIQDENLAAIPNFLKMKQIGKRVVGVPVPNPYPFPFTFIGSTTRNGFFATAEIPMTSCQSGTGKYTIVYQVSDIVGESGYVAKYSLDKLCVADDGSEVTSCRISFEGHADIFEMPM